MFQAKKSGPMVTNLISKISRMGKRRRLWSLKQKVPSPSYELNHGKKLSCQYRFDNHSLIDEWIVVVVVVVVVKR